MPLIENRIIYWPYLLYLFIIFFDLASDKNKNMERKEKGRMGKDIGNTTI